MQYHTYTTLGALSFRCRFGSPRSCHELLIVMPCAPVTTPRPPQPLALHSHHFPFGSSSNQIIMGEVCYDTTCNIPYDFKYCRLVPQTNTSLFSVFCPHSNVFSRNFSEGHSSQNCSKSSTLNCGGFIEWATKKKMHIVNIG